MRLCLVWLAISGNQIFKRFCLQKTHLRYLPVYCSMMNFNNFVKLLLINCKNVKEMKTLQFCAFKICKYDRRIYLCPLFSLSLTWRFKFAFVGVLPVTICEISKKFKILCNSLIVYCSYPYCFAFMCKKLLRHSWRVLKKIKIMTYVNILFLLICHITFFVNLIGCLNPMIKYDWLAEISTLLVERRCDFSTNRTARSTIRAEIRALL
jgi:hypothetical protein